MSLDGKFVIEYRACDSLQPNESSKALQLTADMSGNPCRYISSKNNPTGQSLQVGLRRFHKHAQHSIHKPTITQTQVQMC